MRFASTKRNTYSKEHVRKLRDKRKLMKPKKEGVSQQGLDNILGDLKAAGHLMINGVSGFGIENTKISTNGNKASYSITFNCYTEDELGERPNLSGYLQSASNADKYMYRIKGWFNEDGSIRIELVK